jgi:hypothetical protein
MKFTIKTPADLAVDADAAARAEADSLPGLVRRVAALEAEIAALTSARTARRRTAE